MKETYETGLQGEQAAENYLRNTCGMTLLERRYRTRHSEIDLIMLDGETVVFVEVKTRKTGSPGTGMMAVNSAKQKRIAQGAVLYLMNSRRMNQPVRFDVLEVRPDSVVHVPDAFQPGSMYYR